MRSQIQYNKGKVKQKLYPYRMDVCPYRSTITNHMVDNQHVAPFDRLYVPLRKILAHCEFLLRTMCLYFNRNVNTLNRHLFFADCLWHCPTVRIIYCLFGCESRRRRGYKRFVQCSALTVYANASPNLSTCVHALINIRSKFVVFRQPRQILIICLRTGFAYLTAW